jgi:hypothetical protein
VKRLAFDSAYFRNAGKSDLREKIWHMWRGMRPDMPHLESTLTTDDVKAILLYLRSLPPLALGGRMFPSTRVRIDGNIHRDPSTTGAS